jgi:MFS family permease
VRPVDDAIDEGSLQYEGWRVAIASGTGVLLASFFFVSFAIFLKPLSAEFAWSRQAVSTAYGVMAIGAALAAPVVGHLLDRHGPRWICAPAVLAAGSAFASLFLLTPRLWHLYAVFAVIGLVVMGTGPVVYTRIVVWSAWGVAGAVGSIVMGRAFDSTGSYDGVLVGFGLGTAAAAALMLTLPPCAKAPQAVAGV